MKQPLLVFSLLFMLSGKLLTAQTYQAAGNLKIYRTDHESQLLNNGTVLSFGGYNGYALSPFYYRSAEIYTRSSNSWVYTDSMKVARTDFASAVLNDGRVMAIGGSNASWAALADCELYDPTTGKWTTAASLNMSRSAHKAVTLPNGTILVAAGYDNSCEIYNPSLNKWSLGPPSIYTHGYGGAMTLLANGKVLICGGDGAQKNAEIYDPGTGIWTATGNMQGARTFASIVELNDGRVLVYGSSKITDQNTSELYDPATNSFTATGVLNANRTADPGILLDDGRVFTYGLGEFTSPANTKVFELFDPATKSWSTKTYSFIGSNAYTLSKLFSGELLITGGSSTTGNGANSACLLINASSNTGCVAPSSSLSLNATPLNACYGKDIVVNIPSSEAGVSYKAQINSIVIGSAVNGGGSINLTLPGSALSLGKNVVRVIAYKSGCSSVTLTNTVTITVTQGNTDKPHVTVNGDLTYCDNISNSVTLSSAVSAPGYLWSTGATTASIQPKKTGFYYFRSLDANGCLSLTSDTIFVRVLNATLPVSAGKDTAFCSNQAPVQLIGSPLYGSWSGPGISSGGLLDPSKLADGTYTLQYNYCTKSATIKVTISSPPPATAFTIQPSTRKICRGKDAKITVNGTSSPASYELYVNGTKTGNTLTSGTISWNITVAAVSYIKVLETRINQCGPTITTKYDTIRLHSDPLINLSVIIDTTCLGLHPKVKVFNTEVGYKYMATTFNLPASDTLIGNGGLLTIPLNDFYENNVIYVLAISPGGCAVRLTNSATPRFREVRTDYSSSFAGGLAGESFTLKNLSTAHSYTWNIDGKTTTKFNPDPFTFTTTGLKKITLFSDSRVADCRDTVTRYLEIVDAPTKTPGTSCEYDTLEKSRFVNSFAMNQIMAYHIDKDGNKYISYIERSTYGANYAGSYGLILRKFDKNNHILWEKKHTAFDGSYSPTYFYSNFLMDIESDNSGNVYIAGHFAGDSWKWDNIEIIRQLDAKPVPYLIKLNAAGVVQWHITGPSVLGGNSATAFTDIIYVNDNAIYAAVCYPKILSFPDGTKTDFDGRSVNILMINKDGKLLKKFSSDPSFGEQIINNFNPDPSSYIGYRVAAVSPKISLSSNGKIIVSGKSYNGSVHFNNLTYPTASDYTAFAAVLNLKTGWEKALTLYSLSSTSSSRYQSSGSSMVTIDAANNFYVSDYLEAITIDSLTLKIGTSTKKIAKGAFTAKLDSDGKLLWYSQTPPLRLLGTVQLSDQVLVYGDYSNFFAAGAANRVGKRCKGKNDIVLTSYDFSGKVNWIESISSDTINTAFCIAKERCSDNVYFSGYSVSTSTFMNRSLSLKNSTAIVGKYSGKGNCNIIACALDCAGISGGTAFIDSCKNCAGGNTGITPVLNPKLCITTDVQDATEKEELVIYPNPTSGILNIQTSELLLSISITNAIGELVWSSETAKGNNWSVDISNLPPAIYFIQARTSKTHFYRKVLLTK